MASSDHRPAPAVQFPAGPGGDITWHRAAMIDVTDADVIGALERILESPGFRASRRNKAFLRYIVERTLAGEGHRIKAYAIAVDVFRRDVDFDPARDAIVRNEAARLRSALSLYYAGAGRNDPVEIVLPLGGYVPRFRYRSAGETCPQAAPPRPAAACGLQPDMAVPGAPGRLRVAVTPPTGSRNARSPAPAGPTSGPSSSSSLIRHRTASRRQAAPRAARTGC